MIKQDCYIPNELGILLDKYERLKFELVGITDRLRLKEDENARLREALDEAKPLMEKFISYIQCYEDEFNPYSGSIEDRRLALEFLAKLSEEGEK